MAVVAAAPIARAEDYALILNTAERRVMLELLDAAVRARGLEAALNAGVLAEKIKAAPVVTGRTEGVEPPAPATPGTPADKPAGDSQ
ncbi:MAG: hypothetical protein IT481_08505 [Gammaproteobacteria bacterium]|nr:hypothetical protein [Gammaproteobacteria bacterium]